MLCTICCVMEKSGVTELKKSLDILIKVTDDDVSGHTTFGKPNVKRFEYVVEPQQLFAWEQWDGCVKREPWGSLMT